MTSLALYKELNDMHLRQLSLQGTRIKVAPSPPPPLPHVASRFSLSFTRQGGLFHTLMLMRQQEG